MKTKRHGLILIGLALAGLFWGRSPVWAQGKKPEKTNPKNEKPTHPVRSAKDEANEALNNLDSGIHNAGSTVKAGAEKALDAVDEGVHKVVGSSSNSKK